MWAEKALSDIAIKTIEGVRPDRLMEKKMLLDKNKLVIGNLEIDLIKYDNIYIIGFGKASALMASHLMKFIGNRVKNGWINVKYGYKVDVPKVTVWEAGHPLPDENTIKGTKEILKIVENAEDDDFIITLISGGGSALFEDPLIPLKDLIQVNELLLGCGATIQEINVVRKHISRVKGGWLAKLAEPTEMLALILSDVEGDDVSSIASGPTCGDRSTFYDAFAVLERYGLWNSLAESVREIIKDGIEGKISETPERIDNVNTVILGNNFDALKIAETLGKEKGFEVEVVDKFIVGEARSVAKKFVKMAEETISTRKVNKPVLVVAGGETTVTVRGNGVGGRNQELALAFAIYGKDLNALFLSISTDGTDGPTDAAGAIASGKTYHRALEYGIDPDGYLERNDSYSFFEKVGGLIKIGPTYTNVNDLMLLLVNYS